jgi:hypothetical protein
VIETPLSVGPLEATLLAPPAADGQFEYTVPATLQM